MSNNSGAEQSTAQQQMIAVPRNVLSTINRCTFGHPFGRATLRLLMTDHHGRAALVLSSALILRRSWSSV
jgi:hypothetical protein